jgi:hypothetical protein
MPTQKTGWISIYKGSSSPQVGIKISNTRDEAIKRSSYNRIDTVQITWEE